jgi:hypothetical protein
MIAASTTSGSAPTSIALTAPLVAFLAIVANGLATRAQLRRQEESLDRQLAAQRDSQVTDRFVKAADRLAGNQVQKIGGIYALERIMRESEKDHAAIVGCPRGIHPAPRL